jgi:Domain of unknown function (DUF4407)
MEIDVTDEELEPEPPTVQPGADNWARDGGLSGFLISLSGASPGILRLCPTERPKYTGIASAILTSAVIAAMLLAFALHLDVPMNLEWSVLIAAVLGVVLIALDRWLIASLDRQSNPWRYLILAIPRLAIGVILGIVITTPLLLQIFNFSINAALSVQHVNAENSFLVEQDHSAIGADVTKWQVTVDNLEQVISSHGEVAVNPNSDPVVVSLTARRTQAVKVENDYYTQWQCDLYGGHDCPASSSDPKTQADQTGYENAKSDITSLDNQILLREQAVSNQEASASATRYQEAAEALPNAQAQLNLADRARDALTQSFFTATDSDNGLIPRLEALSEISQGAGTANIMRWLFYVFFTLIQCLPIGVKVLLNLGPENLYEKMLKLDEEGRLRAAREDIARRYTRRRLD